jgi:hypothetical protein
MSEEEKTVEPTLEDRLSFLERRIGHMDEVFYPGGVRLDPATKADVRSLEYADMIILGCLVCLTVLAWYATRRPAS